MKIDELKRELVKYMEETHRRRYHRNFFGCLTALLVEDGPVTQERIMELTGYSKASVSLTLHKLQLTLPVKTLKIMGDRRHYYEYRGGPEQFLVDILERRTEVPDIDLELIHTIHENVIAKVKEHPSYEKLESYLRELHLFLRLMHSIRKKNFNKFKTTLKSGSFQELNFPEASDLNYRQIKNFLNDKMTSGKDSTTKNGDTKDKLPRDYIELKREYFRSIKTGLNPLYAQSVANLLLVVHDVIIEKATTQEAIRDSTRLPRSTISDVVSFACDEGIIQVKKVYGSRTRIYIPVLSLLELILNYYDNACVYASTIRKKICDLLNRLEDITPQTPEFMNFNEKLIKLERAYVITEKFTTRAKAEFIEELMNEYAGQK
ncbi:MAG: hypothetical protein HXS53_12265 [Theionarchaea archaeon]|nr:hypothetical protein [Theionarchaea archaeon]